ncbi:MAG TPA: carboxypeptidase-like regulatory domain-containing protein [Terriglobales bacterium]|nr:carboxypeptidase-like regulatory domain-containing protein [Terriglobales bacterium]
MQHQCPRRLSRPLPVFIVFALLLGSTTLAQDHASTGDSSNTGADGKYVLTGTVVNSVTGEPVPRALVQLYGGSNASMLTDFSGTFRFEGLQQGPVSLTTRKPGFFSPEELNEGADPQSAAPRPIQVGPNMHSVTLQLVPQGSILGRVVNTDGESIEDIGVTTYRLRLVDGRKQWQQGGAAVTGDDGKFRIGNLAPGVYVLRVGPGQALGVASAKSAGTHELGYPRIYYPAESELASATLISVQAGQQAEADFALRPEPMYHISGSITGGDAAARLGAELLDSSGEFSGALRFQAFAGTFFADVVRGHYTLRVRGMSGKQFVTTDVPLNVNSDMSGIQVALGSASTIPVRIRMESVKAPVTRSPSPRHNFQWAPAAVRLTSIDPAIDPGQFGSIPIGEKNSDDSEPPLQQIPGIEPGRYRAEVISNGRWYVQSTTCGSTDLLREILVIAPGEAVPPIEVVLRDDPGRITGVIQADQLNARAAVLLIPANRSTSDIRVAFATANTEQFAFEAIAPGDYELIAFDSIAGLEYRNPEVLTPYRSRAVHVSVARGGEAKANVQVIRRGTPP